MQEKAKQAVPISFAREQQLIKLLMAFLLSGLFFMVIPGSFLGVWNLFSISGAKSASSVSAALIQAHGHAQLFGWIGSFILGIGFYSIPNLRRVTAWSFWDGWLTWALWTTGVGLRWVANVYSWWWQILFPVSALFELLAVVVFLLRSIQGHGMQRSVKGAIEPWTALVVVGTIGFIVSMCLNAFESFVLFYTGTSPTFPPEFEGRFLILAIWGFPVLVAWGFTAHWMPIFLSLKPLKSKLIFLALAGVIIGVVTAFGHEVFISSIILLGSTILMVYALRIFEKPEKAPKIQGVHRSFPVFMRMAYAWLVAASLLLVWAASEPNSSGIGGAGRHAVTVGFLMTMVFSVGPRMLPAFLGRKKLFSTSLMFLALLLTNVGCFIRVTSEIIAYQQYASWAWLLLPVSATLELTGVVVFTFNLIGTFCQPPLVCQPSRLSS